LYARFSSCGEADFQNQLLSAMCFQFGHGFFVIILVFETIVTRPWQ
jgi:hypothetical protein